MMRLAVSGVCGRMGSLILSLALKEKDMQVTAAFEHEGHPQLGKELSQILAVAQASGLFVEAARRESFKKVDVLVDFTTPSGTLEKLALALKSKKGMVIGTTGLSEKDQALIKRAARTIPIVCSPNMSVGANLLFELSATAAKKLSLDYNIEIIEAHHRFKKDAPSGTANRLAQGVAAARKWDWRKALRFGRHGVTGERSKNEIGMQVIRGGDIVGDHTVIFAGDGERIELTHRAQSREAFARGALAAARFIAKKKRGLYSMGDVLG